MIRAAITLKLCSYEETGAIVAAMTTSIPEAPRTARNWDYRYCWLRDAYFVVDALNRLGATQTMEELYSTTSATDRHRRDRHEAGPRHRAVEPLTERIATDSRAIRAWSGPRRQPGRTSRCRTTFTADRARRHADVRRRAAAEDGRRLAVSPLETARRAGASQLPFEPDAGPWEFRGRARRPHLFGDDVLGGVRSAEQIAAVAQYA